MLFYRNLILDNNGIYKTNLITKYLTSKNQQLKSISLNNNGFKGRDIVELLQSVLGNKICKFFFSFIIVLFTNMNKQFEFYFCKYIFQKLNQCIYKTMIFLTIY